MLNRRYIILDCNYLCHRAKYVFGDLSDRGSATGVIYGFLKDILNLRKRFGSNQFIFCWDYGESLRKKMYPTYKEKRHTKRTREERAFERAFQAQVAKLRDEYLYTIGYRNIFYQNGYEADDIIAVASKSITPDLEEAIIVTADRDLWQCIRPNVRWFDPRKKEMYTYKKFKKMFGIKPKQWAKVLAIAGCKTDCVNGIRGVGPVSALSFITGRSKPCTKANIAIKNSWKSVVLRNKPLVQLPFKGTKPIKITEDRVTQKGWDKVTKKLGMGSIRYRKMA